MDLLKQFHSCGSDGNKCWGDLETTLKLRKSFHKGADIVEIDLIEFLLKLTLWVQMRFCCRSKCYQYYWVGGVTYPSGRQGTLISIMKCMMKKVYDMDLADDVCPVCLISVLGDIGDRANPEVVKKKMDKHFVSKHRVQHKKTGDLVPSTISSVDNSSQTPPVMIISIGLWQAMPEHIRSWLNEHSEIRDGNRADGSPDQVTLVPKASSNQEAETSKNKANRRPSRTASSNQAAVTSKNKANSGPPRTASSNQTAETSKNKANSRPSRTASSNQAALTSKKKGANSSTSSNSSSDRATLVDSLKGICYHCKKKLHEKRVITCDRCQIRWFNIDCLKHSHPKLYKAADKHFTSDPSDEIEHKRTERALTRIKFYCDVCSDNMSNK